MFKFEMLGEKIANWSIKNSVTSFSTVSELLRFWVLFRAQRKIEYRTSILQFLSPILSSRI